MELTTPVIRQASGTTSLGSRRLYVASRTPARPAAADVHRAAGASRRPRGFTVLEALLGMLTAVVLVATGPTVVTGATGLLHMHAAGKAATDVGEALATEIGAGNPLPVIGPPQGKLGRDALLPRVSGYPDMVVDRLDAAWLPGVNVSLPAGMYVASVVHPSAGSALSAGAGLAVCTIQYDGTTPGAWAVWHSKTNQVIASGITPDTTLRWKPEGLSLTSQTDPADAYDGEPFVWFKRLCRVDVP